MMVIVFELCYSQTMNFHWGQKLNLKKRLVSIILSLICTSVFAIEFTAGDNNSSISLNFLSGGKLVATIDGYTETLSYTGNPNANGTVTIKDGKNSVSVEVYDGFIEFMGIAIESTESQKRTPLRTFTAEFGSEKITVGVLNSKYARLKVDNTDSSETMFLGVKYSGDYKKNGTIKAIVEGKEIKFELYNEFLMGYGLLLRDTKAAASKPLKTFYLLKDDSFSFITVENDKIFSVTSKTWSGEVRTGGGTYTGSFLKEGTVELNFYDGSEPCKEKLQVSNGCVLFRDNLFKTKDSKPLGKFICHGDSNYYLVIDSANVATITTQYSTYSRSYEGNFFADGKVKLNYDTIKIKDGYVIYDERLYYNEKNKAPSLLKKYDRIDYDKESYSFYTGNVVMKKIYYDKWGTYEGDVQKETVSSMEFSGGKTDLVMNKSYLLADSSVYADKSVLTGKGDLKELVTYTVAKKKNDNYTYSYEFYEGGLYCNIVVGWFTTKSYGLYEGDPLHDGKLTLLSDKGVKNQITISDKKFTGIGSSDKDKIYVSEFDSSAFKKAVYVYKDPLGGMKKYSFVDSVNYQEISVAKDGKETVRDRTYSGFLKEGATIKLDHETQEISMGKNFFWGVGWDANKLFVLEGASLGDALISFQCKTDFATYDYHFLENGILQFDETRSKNEETKYGKYEGDPTQNGTIIYQNSYGLKSTVTIRDGAFLSEDGKLFTSHELKVLAVVESEDKAYGYDRYTFYESNFVEKQYITASGAGLSKSFGTYEGDVLSAGNLKIKLTGWNETNFKCCPPYFFDGQKKYVSETILKSKGEPKILAEFLSVKPKAGNKDKGSYIFYDNGMFQYKFSSAENETVIQGLYEGDPAKDQALTLEYWINPVPSAAAKVSINEGWFYGIEADDKDVIYLNSKLKLESIKKNNPLVSFLGNDRKGNVYRIEFEKPLFVEIKENGKTIESLQYWGDPSCDGTVELNGNSNSKINIENGTFTHSLLGNQIFFYPDGKNFGTPVEEFSNEDGSETYCLYKNSILGIKKKSDSSSEYFKYKGEVKNGSGTISFLDTSLSVKSNAFLLNGSLYRSKNFKTYAAFSTVENSVTCKYVFHEGFILEYQTIDETGNISREYYDYIIDGKKVMPQDYERIGDAKFDGKILVHASAGKVFELKIKKEVLQDQDKKKFTKEK